MELSEAIAQRRSVRAYTPEVVSQATVQALLHAAVQAPSAMNEQPWVFAIVQNAEQLDRYSARAKKVLLEADHRKARKYRTLLSSEAFDIFYDAGTLVVIGVAERGPYTDADCWLAAQNLMLAARAAGLGTCCIGFAVPILNTPDVLAELGFPATGVAVAPIIVGHPSDWPPPIPREPPRVASWSR